MPEIISLFDASGQRKYLSEDERARFAEAAKGAEREVRTFCNMLLLTGCRLSEALAVTPKRVDMSEKVIVIESLKKRRAGVFRAVPVPDWYLDELNLVHQTESRPKSQQSKPLWPFSRQTGYTWIKQTMEAAEVEGIHATPKGLRHSYGVLAIRRGVPLNMLQKWLGHAEISTTAIYANALGTEARELAARMWE